MNNSRTILLTGATGYIGRHLLNSLLQNGYTVCVVLKKEEISPFPEDIKWIKVDENNPEDTINALKKNQIYGVIHLASYVQSGPHETKDVFNLISSNVLFGSVILECAVKAEVEWFINTGTYWQNYQSLNYSPVNLYAATKTAFEDIARYYIESSQIIFHTLRLFDVYGPGDTRPKILNIWERISHTGEVLGMSPGEQILNLTYIDDVISAYLLMVNYLTNDKRRFDNGRIFFLKSTKRYSLKKLAEIFEKVSGRKLSIKWGAIPYRDREIMVPIEKVEVIPEWKSKVGLEEGIKKLLLA